MIKKIKHYIKEIAIFLIVMTIFANLISIYKSTDLNQQAFNIKNITLLNEKKFEYPHAKPLLVHFWATWCPTCKVEASNIQTLSKHYDVLTIAVKSGTKQEIQMWLNENEYNFKVVNDSSGFISSNFNIAAFPTTFIYDKNKELVFSEVGYTSTWGLLLRMWWASL
ncbi:protein disulfide oxidoreductase [Sulfurimonas sp.]